MDGCKSGRSSNLQALCVGCHMDKTANEQENGQFVKFTDTESAFNEKVQEIMNGVLSSSYAFVEQLEKTHMDEKIFTIDINKCRRNILLNHKYDYCVFNVMDDSKEFNINMEIREGLYYIESDNYRPLRGNGWYINSPSLPSRGDQAVKAHTTRVPAPPLPSGWGGLIYGIR